MGWLEDERGLEKCRANYVPLTPLSHLKRARQVFAQNEALVYGQRRYNYAQYHERVSRLASALWKSSVSPGDVVSTILPNTIPHFDAHFGVPACGAVLNTINVRLEDTTIKYILDHAKPKTIIADTQYLPTLEQALAGCSGDVPMIIEAHDPNSGLECSGQYQEYEDFIRSGDPDFEWLLPEDEWESLSLNYTSGTTGRPKGVVYHHRGAYLLTMGTVVSWRLTLFPKYLSIVPLFHCNGWNHPWLIPLLGGTAFCCRDITAKEIFATIAKEGITHFGAAPIILNMLANATEDEKKPITQTVEVFTAGAPPATATLKAIEKLNVNVTHVYGLTETFGHVTECLWNDIQWSSLEDGTKFELKSRQGIAMPNMEQLEVLTDDRPVAQDGVALGEVHIRGNSVMKGYYRNPEATQQAFSNGLFASGDIAMQHPDNYIQITDRAKDIIISGGENVSSVEVEGVIMKHPSVLLCAVVAKEHSKWGEAPFAFVELKPGHHPAREEIIEFCRKNLAGFKVPKGIEFTSLPKTATGKIQKFQLREQLKSTPNEPN